MKKTFSLILLVATFLAGCIPSLHPIYTKKDVIFVRGLLGTWTDEDSKEPCEDPKETWEFSMHADRSYRLVYTDGKNRKGTFVVHLVKIDGTMFMDLYPTELGGQMNDFYRVHLLRVHTFIVVHQIEPRLKMSFMDPEWLEKYLEQNPKAVRYETLSGRIFILPSMILLTSSTKELQAFLLRHVKTKGAFTEPATMVKPLGSGVS